MPIHRAAERDEAAITALRDWDMGEGRRLAAAARAWICFEYEAGQSLRPPKARTWAPMATHPVIAVSGKGTGRISVEGLVCFKPGARGHLPGARPPRAQGRAPVHVRS